MNVTTILWLAGLGASAVIVGQWIFLRTRYLKGITEQRARHQQALQAVHQQLDQAKRQISHLQHELSSSKQQLARLAAKLPSPARPRRCTAARRPARARCTRRARRCARRSTGAPIRWSGRYATAR